MKKLKSAGIGFAILLCVLVPIVAVKAAQIATMIAAGSNPPPMTETVGVFKVQKQQWPNIYKGIGTVQASEGIVITAEASGKVSKIQFESGAQVKKDTILLVQESQNERAQLDAAEARLNLAKINYERILPLLAKNTVSKSEVDLALQQLDSERGFVGDLKATLAKKVVRAPFDGQLGIRKVDPGQDLRVGTEIVSLQATSAVRVNFPVPQFWLVKMQRGLPVSIGIGDGSDDKVSGHVTAIGAEINPVTRNAMLQSNIDNKDKRLIPGMAVDTQVTLSRPREVLAVPTTAVAYATYGDTVFVVEKDDAGKLVAKQHFIKLGKSQGDFVEVLNGLDEGDQVVAAGVFRLKNGQQVIVSSKDMPKFSLNPSPKDS